MRFISGCLTGLLVVVVAGIFGYITMANPKIIDKTVVTMAVAEDVSAEDIIESLKSKAVEVNMKFVSSIPLYKELRARGIKTGHLEIFEFCNPEDAKKMTDISLSFAAYLPCRIVLVEKNDKLFLTMLDLSLIIKGAALEGRLLDIARKVNNSLVAIMTAGSTGDF